MKRFRTAIFISIVLLSSFLPVHAQTVRKESFQGRDVAPGEIIVRFKPSAVSAGQTVAAQDADIASAQQVGRNGAVVMHSRGRSAAELVQAYAGRSDVEYAEPNYLFHKTDFPNDPFFGQQWALQNTGQSINGLSGVANADIHAVSAWSMTVGTAGIVVGVVDTGIDYTHPDLVSNLWTGPASGFDVTIDGQPIHCGASVHGFNAITRTCDPLDDQGHGTHVSGIIGAAGSNGIGVSGINRISSIMALKFLDSSGSGKTTDAIAAIEFAIQVKAQLGANVRVLNNSWSGTGFSQALLDEINSANSSDMLFVAAAGNSSANTDTVPEFPASFSAPNLISVAATDNRDNLWSGSNFGPSTVGMGAPGVNILSTLPNATYGFSTGTSMASPMVSGAAALVLSACPVDTASLRAILMGTVDPLASLSGKVITGGRLDVAQALAVCNGAGSGTFTVATDPNPHVAGPNGMASILIKVGAVNGFGGTVALTASSVPAGMTAVFAPPTIAGSGTSVLTLTLGGNVTPGAYAIRVNAESGGLTQSTSVSLIVPAVISEEQTISGSLSFGDFQSPERPGSFADFRQLVLTLPTFITIDMRSSAVDSFLYLLSPSGTLLNFDDDGGGGVNSRIGSIVLPAGNYLIETTSFSAALGAYTVSVNVPVLDSIMPNSGQAGTSIDVTLLGNLFTPSASVVSSILPVSNINVVNAHTITARLTLDQGLPAGTYAVSVIELGINGNIPSNTIPFTVTAAFPALTSISPPVGIPGTTETIQLRGFGLTPGFTVDAGEGIDISGISSPDARNATMKFSIHPTAPEGIHNVTVATGLGTSNTLPFLVTSQPPAITSVTPAFGTVGTAFSLFITGANFVSPLTIDIGNGITSFGVNVISPTQANVTIRIDAAAELGPRNLTVTSAAGTSNAAVFTVNPVYAVLWSVVPDHVGQGSTVEVTMTGTGFNAPMTVDAGDGISAGNVVVLSSTLAKATLAVSPGAVLGVRNLAVTTQAGTSNPVDLTVLAPFPDLVISEARATLFGVGFNEDYVVTVTNAGSVPTTGASTLTYAFQTAVTFVSASGAGFSCSLSSSTLVTCIYSGTIEAGGQRPVVLTVAVGDFLNDTSTTGTFTVGTAGDSSTANNSVSDNTPIARVPTIRLVDIGSPVAAGTQRTAAFTVSNVFPHPLTGVLLLTFTPEASVLGDDPAIQFSSGGRTLNFTVPANSTQADLAGNSSVDFQTGTVAGRLTLSATIQSAGAVAPPAIPSQYLQIQTIVPVITSFTSDTQSGLTFVVTLYSDTRDVNMVTLTFAPSGAPAIRLSCGAVPGCTAAGLKITFDVQSIFNKWYASDSTFGGAATLRVPFAIGSALSGNVTVSLHNSVGDSTPKTLSLP